MSILFINGSPNKNGNTVGLAKELLAGKEYDTLHLVDYKIYSYGQEYADDQFMEVVGKMKEADVVFQGASPTKEQLAAGDYTAGRYAGLYGFDYQGMVTNKKEAQKLSGKL